MRNLLIKEIKLSSSILSYLFLAFSFMFFIPNYPILCGVFFITLGIFYSFQNAREANDIVFSALLPIAKRDVVKSKYIFVSFIEFCGLILMAVITIIRMTLLKDSPVYLTNKLMCANFFALGMAFVMFALFNLIFLCGFFRTAYKFGKPFVLYIIAAFVVVFVVEGLHFVPGLEALNSFGFENIALQLILLLAGIATYIVITFVSFKYSCELFEKIDL